MLPLHPRQETALQNSKYSAAQFIKLTAQIDALRAELRRERQASHDKESALEEAAEEARSRAAQAEGIIAQLQQQIAHSDYFAQHSEGVVSGNAAAAAAEEGVADDSALYVDAPEIKDGEEAQGEAGSQRGDSAGKASGSTISTVSSRHSAGDSAGTGNAFLANTGGEQQSAAGSRRGPVHMNLAAAAATTAGPSVTPAHSKRNRVSTTASSAAAALSTSVLSQPAGTARESVLTSPTRASYQRTLATVEQFVAGGMQAGTHPAQHGADSGPEGRQPWRPASPHPEPAHIRTGYYTQAGHNRSTLREDGFAFNTSRRSGSSSRGSTPVRSIRPSKHADSLLHNTESSRRKDVSLSPFRRSSPSAILRSARIRADPLSPKASAAARAAREGNNTSGSSSIYRELREGKCSYCAHNLLELWTRKFGAPPSISDGHDGEGKSERRSHRKGKKAAHKKKNRKVMDGSSSAARDESESDTSSDASESGSSGEDKNAEEPPPPPPLSAAAAAPAEERKHTTAVFDSTGNSISYAIGWTAEDALPPPPATAATAEHQHPAPQQLAPHLIPTPINTRWRSSSSSPHSAVHFAQQALRHSRESVDEMSAITEEEGSAVPEQKRTPLNAHATTPASRTTHTGIAAAGVSPPPNTPASTAVSAGHLHQAASRDDEHHHHHHHQHPKVPQRSQSPHIPYPSSSGDEQHAVHRRAAPAAEAGAHNEEAAGNSDAAEERFPGVSSSNETLSSFPVVPGNSGTSQHTAQLLQKLRARNLHPKPYLTSTDARHATTASLTVQCNKVIQEYNAALMTLGNEMLVSENMKADYKREIHESVSLVSELQDKVTSLEAQNSSLLETITVVQAEKAAASIKHDELVRSMQEELLTARVECEDLMEETEGLRTQLMDSLGGSFGGAAHYTGTPRAAIGNSRSGTPTHRHGAATPAAAALQEAAEERRHLEQRISELERVIERQATDGVSEREEAEELRKQVFTLESTLAECRQALTERIEATQSLQHQLARLQAHAAETTDRKAHSQQAYSDAALSEALQKARDLEEIHAVHQQLLQQKDHQIQQLTESQLLQQRLNQTLQQQLVDARAKFTGVTASISAAHAHHTEGKCPIDW